MVNPKELESFKELGRLGFEWVKIVNLLKEGLWGCDMIIGRKKN